MKSHANLWPRVTSFENLYEAFRRARRGKRARPDVAAFEFDLECELLDRRRFQTQAEARLAIFDFIEGWYNPRRRHSALAYLSPMAYEKRELSPV